MLIVSQNAIAHPEPTRSSFEPTSFPAPTRAAHPEAQLNPDQPRQMEQPLDELERLKAENERLTRELAEARTAIRRAKDPTPVQRPTRERIEKFAADAFIRLERVKGGWLLKMGKLVRHFRFLRQIWEILTQEDWVLSDLFPPQKPRATARPRLPYRAPVLLPNRRPAFVYQSTNTE